MGIGIVLSLVGIFISALVISINSEHYRRRTWELAHGENWEDFVRTHHPEDLI